MDKDESVVQSDNALLIGLRIRDARVQRRMTPEELAGQTGVSKAHLCNIEYGRKLPSLEFIISVARTLMVSLDYLLLGLERFEHSFEEEIQMHSDEYLLTRSLYVRRVKLPWHDIDETE